MPEIFFCLLIANATGIGIHHLYFPPPSLISNQGKNLQKKHNIKKGDVLI